MKTIIYTSVQNPSIFFTKTFAILLFCLASAYASAQVASAGKSIKGIVKFSEDKEPAPGVNIYLKGSTAKGTYSDADGKFEFPGQLNTGDVLLFSFIGRETATYVVTGQDTGEIEVMMLPAAIEMVEEILTEGLHEETRPSLFARLFRKEKR
jgi:hypothetical protein